MAKQKITSAQFEGTYSYLLMTATTKSLTASAATSINTFTTTTNTGNYTTTTSSFTIPSDGYYLIWTGADFGSAAIRLDWVVANTKQKQSYDQAYGKINTSSLEYYTSGTIISITATNNTGTTGSMSNAYISCIKLL